MQNSEGKLFEREIERTQGIRMSENIPQEEFKNSVPTENSLFPSFPRNKITGPIPWMGRLASFDKDNCLGLVQYEDKIILSEFLNGKGNTRIISPKEAVRLIIFFEQYQFIDIMDLREVLERMVK